MTKQHKGIANGSHEKLVWDNNFHYYVVPNVDEHIKLIKALS